MNFASVKICRLLHEAGMPKGHYYWKCTPGSTNAELACHTLFDSADIYKISEPYINNINRTICVPAYAIDDIQNILPDYYLERKNGVFLVYADEVFDLGCVQEMRLADALGQMLLNAFQKRIVDKTKLKNLQTLNSYH